jgi:hypothetical protein
MTSTNHNAVAPITGARSVCLNHLRRGECYLATMRNGATSRGIYLGMENLHGDRSIVLAGSGDICSIGLDAIASVEPLAYAA